MKVFSLLKNKYLKILMITCIFLIAVCSTFFWAYSRYVLKDQEQVEIYYKSGTIDESKITLNPTTWTNGNVSVSISNTNDGVIQYKISESGEWKEYTGIFEVEENTTLYVRKVYGTQTMPETKKVISNIDKVAPIIEKNGNPSKTEVNKDDSFTIPIKITDSASGINSGDFTESDIVVKVDGKISTTSAKSLKYNNVKDGVYSYTLTLSGIEENGDIVLEIPEKSVSDIAGNYNVKTELNTGVKVANTYTVTLDNQNATTIGTVAIYEKYGVGIYKESSCTNAMTSTANGITKPERKYTVTYDANGGTVTTQSATSVYTFGGYYTETNGSGTQMINANGFITTNFTNTKYTANATIYAKWTPGTVSTNTPTRPGYTFTGWYDAAEGGNLVIEAGKTYTPTENKTVYAHWSVNTYTITLNNQNATTAGSTAVYEKYGDGIYKENICTNAMTETENAITKPERKYTITYDANGGFVTNKSATATYTFGGYYTETNGSGTQMINTDGFITTNFTNTKYTADATIYAKWTPVSVTLQTPSRAGYTFGGWYKEKDYTNKIGDASESYTPNSDITVYAKWVLNNYNISYDLAGGTVSTSNPTSYNITSSDITLNNPTRTGYTFNGWTEQIVNLKWSKGFINFASGEVDYYAGYPNSYYTDFVYLEKGKKYTLGGYGSYRGFRYRAYDTNLQYLGNVSTTQEYTPSSDCYVRILYYETSTEEQRTSTILTSGTKDKTEIIQQGSTGDRKYSANWISNIYTITLNNQNATTAGSTAIYEKYGIGIYKENACTNAMTETANAITKPERKYTVTYDANGGTVTTKSSTAIYTFGGYYTETNGSGTQMINANGFITTNFTNTKYTANATIYAKWTAGTVSVNTPTREGYTFAGWYDAEEGGNLVIEAGKTYTPTADKTVYAHWTANTYAIAYNKGDATGGTLPSNQTATYNSNLTLGANNMTKNATSNGYTITYANGTATSGTLPTTQTQTISYTANGWATSSNGAKVYESSQAFTPYKLTKGLTLYPSWTSKRDEVTLETNSMTKSNTNLGTVTFNYNGSGVANTTSTAYTTYTANGWTTTSGSQTATYTNGQNITPEENITLYPCFKQIANSAVFPTNPTRTGYSFAGWYTEAVGGTQVTSYTGTSAVTYYAHWIPITYGITYAKGDATGGIVPDKQTADYGSDITLATNSMTKNTTSNGYTITYANGTATSGTLPTKQTQTISYTANGWATSLNGERAYTSGQTIKYTFSEGIILYPSWTSTRNEVTLGTNSMKKNNTNLGTVTFNYNGSGKSSTTSTAYISYKANGWSETSESQTVKYTNGQKITPTKDVTLYPYFDQTVNSAVFPTATRTGYAFKGWYTEAEGGTQVTNYTDASNVTLYAHWEGNKYDIIYNNGDATGGILPSKDQATFGVNFTLAANNMEKNSTANGYTITYVNGTATSGTLPTNQTQTISYIANGWSTSLNGVKIYESSKTFTPYNFTNGLTLYPSWRSIRDNVKLGTNSMVKDNTDLGTVTFDYNGSGAENTTSKAYTTYTAAGWVTMGGSSSVSYSNGQELYLSENITLAPWFKQTANSATFPTNPTRVGYTFAGWYTERVGGTRVTSYTLAGPVTYYAHWTPVVYTISLDNQKATIAGSTAVYEKYNTGIYKESECINAMTETTNAIAKPIRKYTVTFDANGGKVTTQSATATYTFGGYYTATNGSGTQLINENGFVITNFANTKYTANATIYAKWTGGTLSANTPTREGYTFAGWYDAATGGNLVIAVGKTYTPTANKTVYAHWQINTYEIVYNNGDATGGTLPSNQTATYNSNLTLGANNMTKNATSNGYTITYANGTATSGTLPTTQTQTISYTANGWATSSNGAKVYESSQAFTPYKLTKGLTLYPSWTSTRNEVTLGTNSMAKSNTNLGTVTFNYNVNGTVNTTSTAYTTYTANGWTTTSGSQTATYTNGQKITPTVNMTLYPCFKQTANSAVFPTNPTRTGYTFAGWYTEAVGGTQVTSYTGASAVTYYAHWTANTYTITLNNQNATTAGSTAVYEKYNTGIYKESECTNVMTETTNAITKPERKYTITYNANGGTVTTQSATATYTFGGYYTATNGSGTQMIGTNGFITTNFTNTKYTADTTIYAKWTPGTVSANTPIRTGYTFAGWYDAAEGGNLVIAPGKVYTPTANKTVYAHWSEGNVYTIELNNQNATTAGSTAVYEKYENGIYKEDSCTNKMTTTTNAITKPERKYIVTYNANGGNTETESATASYTFGGYYTETNGSGTQMINANGFITTNFTNTKYTANATIYAKWTETGVTLPTATRAGYTFKGWATTNTATESEYTAGDQYIPKAEITLYAVWVDDIAPTKPVITNSSNGKWTNSNVKITIKATDEGSGIKEYQWYENGSWTTRALTTTNGVGTITYTANRNATIKFRAVDNMGNISEEATTEVKIDKTVPTVKVTMFDYNTFTWTASDTVGITAYAITTSSTTPTSWTTTGTLTSGTQDIDSNTAYTYYVWAKDEAGNITNGTITSYKITKIQGTGTTLTIKENSSSGVDLGTTCVLSGTTLYIAANLNAGYTSLELTVGGETFTSGTTTTITGATTIVTTAETGVYTVTLNNQGATIAGSTAVYEKYNTGVYKENSCTNKMTETANSIIKPQRQYTVTYEASEGTVTTKSSTAIYTFGGYYTETNGSGTQMINANGFITTNFTNTKYTANATIYAKWTAGTVSVNTPTREGYTFAGWYDAEEGGNLVIEAGKTYTPTADKTVYAHWTANTYAIAYNKGDATGGTLPSNQTATYNSNLTLGANNMTKNATSNGYTITYANGTATSGTLPTTQTQTISYTANGWATSSNGAKVYESSQAFTPYKLTKELTLYPSWTSKRNEVTLGTNSMAKSNTDLGTVTFNYNGSGKSDTTSTGYTTYVANGWTTISGSQTATYTDGQKITPEENITLYPSFKQTAHSATFPTNPTRTGYTFAGWYTEAEGGTKVTSYTGTSDITYYAHWTPNIYKITLDNMGATKAGSTAVYERYNDGIYLEESCINKMTATENPIIKPEKKYTVTYNANGGTVETETAIAEYIFEGYITHISGINAMQMIDQNGYITSYFANTYTQEGTLPADWTPKGVILPTATKANYVLKGWATTPNATSVEYKIGDKYIPSEDTTLYAVWEEAVASINNTTYYETLEEAINTAQTGDTVYALKQITETVNLIIPEEKDITLDTNGKTITFEEATLTNNGTLTIAGDGTITTSSAVNLITNAGTLNVTSTGIISNTNTGTYATIMNTGTVNKTGSGTITSNCANSSSIATIYGGNVKITDGTVSATTGTAVRVSGTFEITGGTVSTTGAMGVYCNGSSASVSGSSTKIQKSGTSGGSCFQYNGTGTATISGGTISVGTDSGSNAVYNGSAGIIKITGGTIEQKGTGHTITNSTTGTLEVTGGTITSAGNSGIINSSTGTIKVTGSSAKVTGSAFGVDARKGTAIITAGTVSATAGIGTSVNGGTLTIGTKGGTPSTTVPSVTGTTYGVLATSGTFNFYDGVIKGADGQSISGTVSAVETNYAIVKSTSNGIESATLQASNYRNETTLLGYTTLQNAVNDSASGTKVLVLKGISDSSTVTVDSAKTIEINTNGKTTTLSSTLTNNGTLTISGAGTITTSSAVNLITNAGTLNVTSTGTISNTNTGAYAAIMNTGTVNKTGSGTVSAKCSSSSSVATIYGGNLKITAGTVSATTGTAVRVSGTFEITGGTVSTTGAMGVYCNGSSASVSGSSTKIQKSGTSGGSCFQYNGTGTATISGGTISVGTDSGSNAVYNGSAGIIKITGGTIEQKGTGHTITNSTTGTLEVTGGTITSAGNSGIINSSTGTIKVTGSSAKVTGSAFGVDARKGTAIITAGTVSATAGIGTSVNGGTLTIGTKGGTPSTTVPSVTGTTYGVLATSGTFNFYDGVIKGADGQSISGTVSAVESGYGINKKTSNSIESAILVKANYLNTTSNSYYDTLASAFSDSASGSSIKVLVSVTETKEPTVATGKTLGLVLNEKTITLNNVTLVNNGTLNISNPTGGAISSSSKSVLISNRGKLTTSGTGALNSSGSNTINNYGTCEIKGFQILGTSSSYPTIYNQSGASLTVSSGIVSATTSSAIANLGTVTVSGGKVKNECDNINSVQAAISNSGKAIVSGGEISAILLAITNNSILTIKSGTISCSAGNTIANRGTCNIEKDTNSYATITGNSKYPTIYNYEGTLSISAGKISAEDQQVIVSDTKATLNISGNVEITTGNSTAVQTDGIFKLDGGTITNSSKTYATIVVVASKYTKTLGTIVNNGGGSTISYK